MMCLIRLCVLGVVVGLTVASSPKYEQLCDEIVAAAKAASRAYNDGDAEAAAAHSDDADRAYKAAIALDPNEPQAFVNMGVFYSNSHKFDAAVVLLEDALKRIPKSDGSARSPIDAAIRKAKYGKYSQLRDRAYDNGKGDIRLAHQHALQQLKFTNQPQITAHEVATLELMLCDGNISFCDSASRRLMQAQTSSVQHFTRLRGGVYSGTQAMQCIRGPMFVGRWGPHANVTDTRVVESAGVTMYAHELRAKHVVMGRDGLVALRGSSDCAVFSPASDSLINVGANLLIDAARLVADPSSKYYDAPGIVEPVLSLMQFSSSAFYHWMCECVPRLVVAMEVWGPDLGSVLIPKVSPANRFIMDTLELLRVPDQGITAREYQGTHLGSHLRYVTWSKAGEGFSLTHPDALRRARTALTKVLADSPFSQRYTTRGRKVLLAARGKQTTMRNFDEDALARRLKDALEPQYDVVTFDGNAPLQENLAVFREAAVVVGAHGGALANMIVCDSPTAIVEIGFRSLAARHYEHVARSLGLKYEIIHVYDDPLGRGMGAPTIDFDQAAVVDAVKRMLDTRRDEL